MEREDPSAIDFLIETHVDLERQGPGSSEMTVKALSFIDDLDKISRVADFGCGTGAQTMVLAQHVKGDITGLDLFPHFINIFNNNAGELHIEERVTGIVGSMENLSFEKDTFDLIWSEGAIDNIGFEKGVSYWNGFLKKGGCIAVTSPSWLTEEHIAEVEKFWSDAGSGLDTVGHNIKIMEKHGYRFIAAFALPDTCWTENYFIPRGAKEAALLKKYAGNAMVEDAVKNSRYEVELYSRYKQHYGYVFYIGKKV